MAAAPTGEGLPLDAIHYKIRENGRYQSKAVYTVLALDLEGKKEVLGLYCWNSERSQESCSYNINGS